MIIPIRVNTLAIRPPWASLAILTVNIVVFGLMVAGLIPEDVLESLILQDWSPVPMVTYQFLHAGLWHLVGNMIFLWVFGNSLNGIMHDHDFALTFLGCGIFAAALHLTIDGSPVVGASGAINEFTAETTIIPRCWTSSRAARRRNSQESRHRSSPPREIRLSDSR